MSKLERFMRILAFISAAIIGAMVGLTAWSIFNVLVEMTKRQLFVP